MMPDNQLIERYLKGQCSEEEYLAVEAMLRENPSFLDEYITHKEWDLFSNDTPYPKEKEILARIHSWRERRMRRVKTYKWISSSAAVLLCLISFTFYFIFKESPLSNTDTIANVEDPSAAKTVSNLYYINSGNENMVLKCSDGSSITLYPQSEVRYAEDFTSLHERKIEMKGKATFRVAKDKAKAFKVYSKDMVTVALGTVFTINEIKSDETHVHLEEGSIEVSITNKELNATSTKRVKPNESIVFNHQTGKIMNEKNHSNSVSSGQLADFQQDANHLMIKNMLVKDVLKNLEKSYKVQFQYDSIQLRKKYFTGTFNNSDTVYNQIINEINYLHGLKISLKSSNL